MIVLQFEMFYSDILLLRSLYSPSLFFTELEEALKRSLLEF